MTVCMREHRHGPPSTCRLKKMVQSSWNNSGGGGRRTAKANLGAIAEGATGFLDLGDDARRTTAFRRLGAGAK